MRHPGAASFPEPQQTKQHPALKENVEALKMESYWACLNCIPGIHSTNSDSLSAKAKVHIIRCVGEDNEKEESKQDISFDGTDGTKQVLFKISLWTCATGDLS